MGNFQASARRRGGWLTLLLAAPLMAQQGGDVQAQIVYAFQTEDAVHLHSLRQGLQQQVRGEHPTDAARYHLAHADYRLALLTHGAARSEAAEDLQECVDVLAPMLEREQVSAEVLALQSICYVELAHEKKLQAVFLRARAAERIARAASLEPRNPRVKWVQALQKMQVASESDPPCAELVQAVELFEQSSATSEETPGWGHAEAYLLMGHTLRARGDALGARNWIEKALIAAPDYKAAQAELARLNR